MDKETQFRLWSDIAAISGIFCAVVALLLLFNFWQMAKQDPLKNKALETLVQRLSENPSDDGLRNDVRNLDLLARKAYFNSEWQVKTGSYLLLFGGILFALSIRIIYSLKSRIELSGLRTDNELKNRILSSRWILVAGAAILVLTLAASFVTVDHLKDYHPVISAGILPDKQDTAIKVIEVGVVKVPEAADSVKQGSAGAPDSNKSGAVMGNGTASETVSVPSSPDAAQIRANYPSFRGPFGNGISNAKNIPVDFDGPSGRNILWKVNVPLPGYNSPVIWGDKLFLSGANTQKRELYCFDRYGGKLLWTASADNIPGSPAASPKTTEDTGLAASGTTTDGNFVFAIFANGDVMGVDMKGNRLWARNLGLPDNHYGHASSLLVWKDKLYIQYDTNKSRKLMALSAQTGETLWETNRNVKISWASPIIASIGGRYQVILAADPLLAGYDAESGKELWTSNCLSGEVGCSPAYGEGLVFAANEYARLSAVNPASGQIVWEQDEYLPEVASLVVGQGLLFVATSYGILACYDAKSGEKKWEHDSGRGYYSSPIVADGKLFTFDMEGRLQVFALTTEKKLLAEANLGVKMTTTPAFANNRMYVRAGGALYCIGTK